MQYMHLCECFLAQGLLRQAADVASYLRGCPGNPGTLPLMVLCARPGATCALAPHATCGSWWESRKGLGAGLTRGQARAASPSRDICINAEGCLGVAVALQAIQDKDLSRA